MKKSDYTEAWKKIHIATTNYWNGKHTAEREAAFLRETDEPWNIVNTYLDETMACKELSDKKDLRQ